MAKINYILQGLFPENDHYEAVRDLLGVNSIKHCILSVAFVNKSGVELILDKLLPIVDKTELFIGIGNDITSKEGLELLVSSGLYPKCINTGSVYIYHPKIYLSENEHIGKVIVGSANLTSGGLVKNIESSLYVELDLSNKQDKTMINDIKNSFYIIEREHPNNVIHVKTNKDIELLLENKFIVEENRERTKAVAKARGKKQPAMKLNTRKIKQSKKVNLQKTMATAPISKNILWISAPLKRRDLTIPTSANTHATGSMLFSLGDKKQKFDFRHYFRDVVFENADWLIDEKKPHYERAIIKFQIIVNNINHGIFELKVSHNNDKNSKSYKQKNSMTSVSWGTAKSVVANEGLLGYIMRIYKPVDGSDVYTITFLPKD